MKIEERVAAAILEGMKGETEKGLTYILPAIEGSARKGCTTGKVGQSKFKKFIRRQYRIIEAFLGAGIDLENSHFPALAARLGNDKPIERPDLADIIYHIFRCGLMHGWDISSAYSFSNSGGSDHCYWVFDLEADRFSLPDKLLWALIAVVVFAEENEDIETVSDHFLTWGPWPLSSDHFYHFDIDLFWGEEQRVKRFLKSRNLIRVALKF